MAKNRVFAKGTQLSVAVAGGTVSGQPVLYGARPGVALTDRRADGKATVQFDGVFDLLCEAVVAAGNSAIAEGDVLYYDAAATIKINKDVTNGVRYGYAAGTVASGASGTIPVILGY